MPSSHFLEVSTSRRCELVDITQRIQTWVLAIGVRNGLCTVFCPHTTAGLTINENADPDVKEDLLRALERAVPNRGFQHGEGNSDAHVKATLVGSSVQALVGPEGLELGTWQGIFLCEFDGPRQRQVKVQILP